MQFAKIDKVHLLNIKNRNKDFTRAGKRKTSSQTVDEMVPTTHAHQWIKCIHSSGF